MNLADVSIFSGVLALSRRKNKTNVSSSRLRVSNLVRRSRWNLHYLYSNDDIPVHSPETTKRSEQLPRPRTFSLTGMIVVKKKKKNANHFETLPPRRRTPRRDLGGTKLPPRADRARGKPYLVRRAPSAFNRASRANLIHRNFRGRSA